MRLNLVLHISFILICVKGKHRHRHTVDGHTCILCANKGSLLSDMENGVHKLSIILLHPDSGPGCRDRCHS